mmetsp:Transcript_58178/g.127557  ORF Transcript_58178/g.127557 Transcript_58178/m.127557 type:complete len:258 (+) Transcript_58178:109-882(+)
MRVSGCFAAWALASVKDDNAEVEKAIHAVGSLEKGVGSFVEWADSKEIGALDKGKYLHHPEVGEKAVLVLRHVDLMAHEVQVVLKHEKSVLAKRDAEIEELEKENAALRRGEASKPAAPKEASAVAMHSKLGRRQDPEAWARFRQTAANFQAHAHERQLVREETARQFDGEERDWREQVLASNPHAFDHPAEEMPQRRLRQAQWALAARVKILKDSMTTAAPALSDLIESSQPKVEEELDSEKLLLRAQASMAKVQD